MNHEQMAQLIEWVRSPDRHVLSGGSMPICIWGMPGVGKTSGIRGYCEAKTREIGEHFAFLSYQPVHDAGGHDLIGEKIVKIGEGKEKSSVKYQPPLWLPDTEFIETTGLGGRRIIKKVDEINRAQPQVVNALMELLQERQIGKSGYHLPKGYSVIAAANYAHDGRNKVAQLDDAMLNRMLHVHMSFSADGWLSYMESKARPPHLTAFARNNLDKLPDERSDLPDDFYVPITPRSFENLACLFEPGMDRELLRIIAQGTIGKELAADFMRAIAESEAAELHRGQLTVDLVMSGQWQGALAADLAAGNAYHVQGVAKNLAYRLRGWGTNDEHAAQLASFIVSCPERIGNWLEADLHAHTSSWSNAVASIIGPMRLQSQTAAREALIAPRTQEPSTSVAVPALPTQLTAEHIAQGTWAEPLAADLADGRQDGVQAATDTLVDWMTQWPEATDDAVENFALFMSHLPPEIAARMAHAMRERADHWLGPVKVSFDRRRAAAAPAEEAVAV